LRDADVVFRGGTLVHVGKGYAGEADTVVDGKGRLILPGFVNIHSHPTSEPLLRGLTEERKSRKLGMSTLYEYTVLVGRSNYTTTLAESQANRDNPQIYQDDGARSAAFRLAVWEMLKSGVTTLVDYSPNRADWIDEALGTGLRVCLAPSFRSGYWYTPNGHEVLYEFDEAAGRRAFDEAVRLLDAVAAHPSDRIFGMMAPGQIDTCKADLLQDARDAARERKLPMTLHAAQSVVEFREMVRRHGKTPIEWLESIGLLAPNFIIGHAIFIDEHSWIEWPDRRDLGRIADSGSHVAHCPHNFVRGGVILQHFGKYRRAGINIGLGTDTHPHNFVDEMRWATIIGKVAARDIDATRVEDVFYAGTVGGAKALQRDDIGRLAPGCKADLVVVDCNHPMMQPLRDPLRSFIFSALDRPITDVYVDGEMVVRNGEVLTVDVTTAGAELTAGQQRALKRVPDKDWAGRSADEAFPLALETVDAVPAGDLHP
ncbi:MAG: amidohydrolase family protein, partial [Alphaproteobacteria bacterium]